MRKLLVIFTILTVSAVAQATPADAAAGARDAIPVASTSEALPTCFPQDAIDRMVAYIRTLAK